jgi:hypothetical protein
VVAPAVLVSMALLCACGGARQSAPATTRSASPLASSPSRVAAWPGQAVAALKKPWIQACATTPEKGTSRARCTTLFECLEQKFSVHEFVVLTAGYFQGGALPSRDRPSVVGCFSRAHITPSG